MLDQPTADMRTAALLRIASAIETAANLDELLMLALHELRGLLSSDLCGVVLIDDEGETARLVSLYPPRVSLPGPFRLADTQHMQTMLERRQTIHIADADSLVASDERPSTVGVLNTLRDLGARSLLLIPLVALDHLIGVAIFASVGSPRVFHETEVALGRLMSSQLAAAITSFRTTAKAQRRTAELETLNDIAAAVTSSLDTREIYHLVVEKLNEYFRVDAGSLLMRDEQTGDLMFVMTLEGGEEKLAGVRVPRGRGIVGDVAENQHYVIVHDPNNDPRFYPDVSKLVNYVTNSILCVPIVVKGRTIGVIELINKREGRFTEEEATRLSRMAATIGVAIENARLFQQVANGRDRLQAILNSTNDGIIMADTDGVVLMSNPMAAQVLGRPQDRLVGRPLAELLTALHQQAVDISRPSWLNDGDDSTPDVIDMELPGDQRRFVRHFTLPVRDAQGHEIGRLALLQDISKERELNQLRDDYTGMLVHDLRAPLTAIMNGVMMVKRGLGGPVSDTQQELLGIAHHSSQTMLEMINTLLDISKMEEGRIHLNIEPLVPYALADETFDRLRASAQSQRVQLVQQLALGLPLVEADRESLVRVLQNLLDNAIKFSPGGSTVTLGAAWVSDHATNGELPLTLPDLGGGEWLVFWVRDQGPGIPPLFHTRVFEKFGQVRGRKVRGTGLGLTFCKLTVEAHGGRIWLESAEGRGSTFAFAVPVNADQRARGAS